MQEPPSDSYEHMSNGQDRTRLTNELNNQSLLDQSSAEFRVNDIIGGDYQVLRWIGAGGMGNVYCVRHTIMQTEYALKTLSADKVTEIAWRRFQNEAQAIARMSHPNIVGIYNLGLHEARLPFYVMDLLKGETLLDLLRARGPMEWTEALPLFIELCAGFGYAHKKGIVHRDIKPPNIVLMDTPEPACRVKIVDFGIAKLSGIKDPQNQYLTNVGEVCGSPYYMSPEQTEGQRIDARSDIYSLGCTLFEILTGAPPLRGRNAMDTMLLHQTTAPPTLKTGSGGKEFPEMLEQVMATLLAKAPMDRYQTMELVSADLSTIMAGQQSVISPYITQTAKKLRPADLGEGDTKGRAGAKLPPRLYQAETVEHLEYEQERSSAKKSNFATIFAISAAAIMVCTLVAGGIYFMLQPKANNGKVATVNPSKEQPLQFAADLDNMATKISSTDRVLVREDNNNIIPTKSLKETFPFSKVVDVDGRRVKVFNFPEDITIGDIKGKNDEPHPARGTISYALKDQRTFYPDPILVKFPAYVTRFRPDDVYKISLQGPKVTDALLKVSADLPGAKMLEIIDCPEITTSGMEAINNMSSLNSLKVDHGFPGQESIGNLKKLEELHTISMIDQKESALTAVLKMVKNSKKLIELALYNDTLTGDQFKILAAIPSLTSLYLDNSQFAVQDLQILNKSNSVKGLSLVKYHVSPELLKALKSFKNLKIVMLTLPASDEVRFNQIKAELAPIRVEQNLDRTDAISPGFGLD